MAGMQIKFGTDGWRAVIGDGFTFVNLARVTEAVSIWLKSESPNPSVMLGYDCRFNAMQFAQKAAARLAENGIRVFFSPSFVSTPMVSLATAQRQCTAGLILTASHNPPEYLGLKVKASFGGPAHPATIARIESLIPESPPPAQQTFEEGLEQQLIEYYDMEALYVNHLRQRFDLNLVVQSGLRLGFDAMFGAGQRVFRMLFPTAHLLHCVHNPGFEGRSPEPIESNLLEFRDLILNERLDWGLATDGDADRIGLFDGRGNFVDSHHILLLLIHYLYHYKGLRGKVVTTFSTTSRIPYLCQLYNLPHEVTPIGFKYIGEIMSRETVMVGGEESGGIAVMGHVPERDGIYIGLLVLEMMATLGRSLLELIEDIHQIVGSFSMQRADIKLTESEKQRVIESCRNDSPAAIGEHRVSRTETLDGFKYHLADGEWVMLRASGTEPVLRIYSEAKAEARARQLIEAARQCWAV